MGSANTELAFPEAGQGGRQMLAGAASGCINHPGIEAAIRCKQCSKPVCSACIVAGPTGQFCSLNCSQTHQQFAARAREMEGRARSSFFPKVRGLLMSIIVFAAVLFALGFVATIFEIPV